MQHTLKPSPNYCSRACLLLLALFSLPSSHTIVNDLAVLHCVGQCKTPSRLVLQLVSPDPGLFCSYVVWGPCDTVAIAANLPAISSNDCWSEIPLTVVDAYLVMCYLVACSYA